MTTPASHEFVVSDDAENWFSLEFRGWDDASKQWFAGVWQRMSGALEKAHKIAESNSPEWIAWKPWVWCESRRPGYESRQTHVAWCGPAVAGFLNVWPDFPSQDSGQARTLYIEHLAATPGNQNSELWRRRFRHVGTALLAYAVKLSNDQGFEGRISLHAANVPALAFYRKIAQDREPLLFIPERTGVVGPTPHSESGDWELTYLEMTPEGAMNFLEDYRHE